MSNFGDLKYNINDLAILGPFLKNTFLHCEWKKLFDFFTMILQLVIRTIFLSGENYAEWKELKAKARVALIWFWEMFIVDSGNTGSYRRKEVKTCKNWCSGFVIIYSFLMSFDQSHTEIWKLFSRKNMLWPIKMPK